MTCTLKIPGKPAGNRPKIVELLGYIPKYLYINSDEEIPQTVSAPDLVRRGRLVSASTDFPKPSFLLRRTTSPQSLGHDMHNDLSK